MAEVMVRGNESFEHALRRFVTFCKKDGVLSDFKAHQHFEKPSERRKRKRKAARRRILKAQAKQNESSIR